MSSSGNTGPAGLKAFNKAVDLAKGLHNIYDSIELIVRAATWQGIHQTLTFTYKSKAKAWTLKIRDTVGYNTVDAGRVFPLNYMKNYLQRMPTGFRVTSIAIEGLINGWSHIDRLSLYSTSLKENASRTIARRVEQAVLSPYTNLGRRRLQREFNNLSSTLR
jgi:hypothetical protein